jgi:hypothetical protein
MALLYNRIPELTIERQLIMGPNSHLSYTGGRNVSLKATRSLVDPAIRDRNLVLDLAGTVQTYTLPAATGSGRKYKFYVGTVNTANYIIKSARVTDLFKGTVILAGASVLSFTAGASNATFTLNGTTTGGAAVCDWVEFVDLKANVWGVDAVLTYTGTAATPLST